MAKKKRKSSTFKTKRKKNNRKGRKQLLHGIKNLGYECRWKWEILDDLIIETSPTLHHY